MAEVVRYVDRDVVGGAGDGTSWADAYPTLDAWQTAEATDLVTAVDRHIVYYRANPNNPRTAAFSITGWTTDVNSYVMLIVPPESRHNGTRGSGTHFHSDTGSSDYPFIIEAAYTVIDGLHVWTSDLHAPITVEGLGDNSHLMNCLAISDSGAAALRGVGGIVTANNCIFISYSTSPPGVEFRQADMTLVNCTIAAPNAPQAFKRGTSPGYGAVINCYGYAATTAWDQYNIDASTSHSPDATFHGIATSLAAAAFVSTVANEESLLLTSGSALIDVGQDNSAHAAWRGDSVDILGTTRPQGAGWDIGANEFSSSGATIPSAAGSAIFNSPVFGGVLVS